jgi:hypothetical protein
MATTHLIVSAVLNVAWVDEHEALDRLDRVSWYDTGPLRRLLADGQRPAVLTVVDRR